MDLLDSNKPSLSWMLVATLISELHCCSPIDQIPSQYKQPKIICLKNLTPPHLPESTCPSQLFLHQHQFPPPFNSPSHHPICGTVDSTPNFRCHELWSATYTIRLLTLLHGEVSQNKMLVEISGASPVVPQVFKNNYRVLAILLKHVYYTTKSFKLLSLSHRNSALLKVARPKSMSFTSDVPGLILSPMEGGLVNDVVMFQDKDCLELNGPALRL